MMVDIRNHEEFSSGHYNGAFHFPAEDAIAEQDPDIELLSPYRGSHIVVVGNFIDKTSKFANKLVSSYFPYVSLLSGGMAAPSSNPKAFTYEVLYYEGTGYAELSRLIIRTAGFQLSQKFVDDDTFPSFKPSLLFGQVPKLSVKDAEGKVVFEIVQSRAIEKYLGTLGGLFGKTPEETAKIEQYTEAVRDALETPNKTWWESATARKDNMHKHVLPDGSVTKWCGRFEEALANNSSGFIVGNELTVADLAVYYFAEEMSHAYSGHVPSHYKHLAAHFAKVKAIPKVHEYISDPSRVKSFFSQPDLF